MMTVKNYSQKVLLIIVVTILILSGFISVLAQKTSPAVTISPTMKVSNLKTQEENPMRLDVLKVDVKVLGQIAVTTLDMTYFNNNNRVMEGEFNFPLAEGQTVTRFALDINGAMREGVVVEKEKGRKTFESVVRRGVDPGLLEKTEGNNFRARVYPLPAKGSRRIIIAFEQELTNKGENDLYILPMLINEAVSKFSFHAEVIKNTVRFDSQNNELTNLSFKKWNDSYVADYEQVNFIPNKQVALNFPHTGDSATIFTAVKNTGSDSSYFMINLRPQITEKTKKLPKSITVLWDNSNSAQDRDINKELKVLENYIQKIGTLSVDLVFFNIKLEKPIKFDITNGNCDKLIDAIKATQYDGATCLGNLDFSKFKSDEILLFTDGLSTFGASEPRFFNTSVYTINSNPVANHSVLTYIAQSSGGSYINLSKLTVNESITLLTNSDFHFISAKIISGNVSQIYPSMPCQFSNSFSLAGIVKGNTATIQLNFGFGSTVVYSRQIEIQADNNDEPALLRRF